MKILIGADVVPHKGDNEEYFIKGNAEKILGKELKYIVDSADLRIYNLEVPLTDIEKPIKKAGPNLIAKPETVAGYKAIGADILTIANNHVMDQDTDGFINTLKVLDKAGIKYIGGGLTKEQACAPYIANADGKKVVFYAVCENEFSRIEDYGVGTNGFDPLYTPDEIYDLKKDADYVVVLYHGGKEEYRYPSPMLRKRCRKMVEKGADLIVCTHTHCVGCEEDYLDGKIVYGIGNFIFLKYNRGCWANGMLVSLDISKDGAKVDYVPVERVGETSIKLSDDKSILGDFYARSEEIKKDGFVEQNFLEYARSYDWYKKFYTPQFETDFGVTHLVNYYECEPHVEIITCIAKDKMGLPRKK